jgi:hypothetical protein
MTHKQIVTICETFLPQVGSRHTFQGKKLSRHDNYQVTTTFQLWLLVVLECLDIKPNTPAFGRWGKLAAMLADSDVFELLSALDELDDLLLSSTVDSDKRNPGLFKAIARQAGSGAKPLQTVLGLVKSDLQCWCEFTDIQAFKTCHQLFTFMKRLPLKDVAYLKMKAFDGWVATQERLQETSYCDRELLSKVAHTISRWFPAELWPFDEIYPHHGCGATAETLKKGANVVDKSRYLTMTPSLRLFYQPLGWMNMFDGSAGLMGVPVASAPDNSGADACILAFVPKSWKTFRTISMELTRNMFAQQAVKEWIYARVRSHQSGISRFYAVDTDWRNQLLAKQGSRDGSVATIDFSSASDSVSYQLFKLTFRQSCLYHPCIASRTRFVQFTRPGENRPVVLPMMSFAPMGSATCFPIETILFLAIAWNATNDTPGASFSKLAGYGDDICIDSYAADLYMDYSTRLGLVVNRSKSYYNDSFKPPRTYYRESCGKEYLNGYDVTPVRLPRKFEGFPSTQNQCIRNPNLVDKTVSLANNLKDYKAARYLLIHMIKDQCNLAIPFSSDGSIGFESAYARPYGSLYTFPSEDTDCQKDLYLYDRASSGVSDRHYESEEVRLYEYLRTYARSTRKTLSFPDDVIEISTTRLSPRKLETYTLAAEDLFGECTFSPQR